MSDNPAASLVSEEPTYNRAVFESILKGMGDNDSLLSKYRCEDSGAWVTDADAQEELAWHPWCEVSMLGSPDPLVEPWLRFPFTARHLAALMVYGYGYFIQERYGSWESGPDETALLNIGQRGVKAKEALRGAYDAYRQAEAIFPRQYRSLDITSLEINLQYKTDREAAIVKEGLRDRHLSDAEYTTRLARVNKAVAELGDSMDAARKAADLALHQWRRSVVQHLLLPIEAHSTPASVVAEAPSNRDVGPPDYTTLATREALCTAFGSYGLKPTWFNDLHSRKWLLAARKQCGQGQRGRHLEPLFCPFEVMNGLVQKSRRSWLSIDSGWRILEQEFPAAYAAVSLLDPREATG